jgi:hypothetical protein
MRIGPTVELRASVGQHQQQRDLMLVEEGQNLVVEPIRRFDGMLCGVKLVSGYQP